MQYRKRLKKSYSKRLFTKTASRVKSKNYAMPMRGGIRM
jgi:hypothetical protein